MPASPADRDAARGHLESLLGLELGLVTFWVGGVRLVLGGWELTVGASLQLTGISADGAPAGPVVAGTADVLLRLLEAPVSGADLSDRSTLSITFGGADQRTLSAVADDHYEAWELAGPGGERLVCLPGGDLAIWGRRDGTPH